MYQEKPLSVLKAALLMHVAYCDDFPSHALLELQRS